MLAARYKPKLLKIPVEPPAALVLICAVSFDISVIVTILCAEGHAQMICPPPDFRVEPPRQTVTCRAVVLSKTELIVFLKENLNPTIMCYHHVNLNYFTLTAVVFFSVR